MHPIFLAKRSNRKIRNGIAPGRTIHASAKARGYFDRAICAPCLLTIEISPLTIDEVAGIDNRMHLGVNA